MIRIAILGPGAIGSTILAWLAQNPSHALVACVRTPFRTLEVETPSGPLRVAPEVLTEPDQGSPVDWLLISTKTYDTEGASRWFPKLLGPQTRVAVLQNGVEHVERFSPFIPAPRILPVVIDCPAERSAPGRVRQRGPVKMTVPAGPLGQAFAGLFEGTPTEMNITDDFLSAAWRKLCLNAPGAVSAIALKPASIVRQEGMADVIREMVREAIAVGRAEGAVLDDGIVESVLTNFRQAPPDSINSLHADRAAGRPMEIDARNGAIVRLGREHHLATPYNAMAVALLKAVQNPSA